MIEVYHDGLRSDFEMLALKFHRESEVSVNTSLNIDKLVSYSKLPNVLFTMFKSDDKYVGCFLGYITPYSWSDDLMAFEEFLYVEPESRGGSAAVKMVKFFEEWAIERGIKTIFMSQGSAIDIEKTTRFFNRMGYETVGYMARKAV